eukprot:4732338-Alexandrium_andersonii.AAC.1
MHVARRIPELIPAQSHELRLLVQFLRVHTQHSVHDREGHVLIPQVGRAVVVRRRALRRRLA